MKNKHCYGQSGVQGFFGRIKFLEYWYQLFYFFVPGYNFIHCTFVAKTATLKPRVGNTDLRKKYKIKSWYPSSIWVSLYSFWHGYMLNAIGLSNPGLEFMLNKGDWQKRDKHFHISLQLEAESESELYEEINNIIVLLKKYLNPKFHHYSIQINVSCPNTEHDNTLDTQKLEQLKMIARTFKALLPEVKLYYKWNALVTTQILLELKDLIDGNIISNTIPFGDASSGINWENLFTHGQSPLPYRLGLRYEGGLSGLPIYSVLVKKLQEIEEKDPDINVIAGGGIMTKKQIDELSTFSCVKGIALGTVGLLRPWRVKKLSSYANKVFAKRA